VRKTAEVMNFLHSRLTTEYKIRLVQVTTGSTKSGFGQDLFCPEISVCYVCIHLYIRV